MNIFMRLTMRFCIMFCAMIALVSCDKYNYVDDLQSLGERVEILEQKVLEANTELETLNELIVAIENKGYVTEVVEKGDSTIITFSTGKTFILRQGRNGTDGKDGINITLDLSVAQDETDGLWYWTYNGTWLLTENGQRMRAGAYDGKDGKTAEEVGIILPQVRINSNRNWEISTDGGKTWKDTGISADGKNGQKGTPDRIYDIVVSNDGTYITIYLRDGRIWTVPLLN